MNFLENKTIVITGISKGIGKCLAEKLLQKGACVAGWGLHDPEISHANLNFISCDVSHEAQVNSAIKETIKWKGAPDMLINNAGFGYFSTVEDFEMKQFDRMLEVNLRGAMLCTKACVPGMKEKASGHILNISSVAGRVGAAQGAGYNASKFALAGLSESLFHELRTYGIKVTTVYPGSTATNFFDDIPGFKPNPMMLDPDEVADMIINVLNTSANFLVREIEMRPLNSKK